MSAPPVVFLHGAASTCATWDRLRERLEREGVTSHAFALLGHADQPRRSNYCLGDFRNHALAQLDALGHPRVVLVGHSLGAFTAMLIAQDRPHRVARLVLEEPPVPRRTATDGPPFTPLSHVRMWTLSPLARKRMDPRALRQVLHELTAPMLRWWSDLDEITAPTLLVAGGVKSHLDQNRYRMLATRLPDCRLQTVGGGHRVHSERPAAYAAAVLPLLLAGSAGAG